MTPNEETATEDEPRGPRISAKSALLGFVLIVATFVAAGLYLSAAIKLQRVEAAAATERAAIEQRAAAEREALLARANAAAAAQAAELLKMAALPLSWAVRQELQDKSYRESALYFQQLVGLGGVQRIALVSREGSIRVASDKKLEGRTATEAFRAPRSTRTARAVRPIGAKGLEAVSADHGAQHPARDPDHRLRSREGRSATHASPAARHLTRAVRKRGHASCTSGASLPIGTKDQKRLRNNPRRSSDRGFVTATKCLRVARIVAGAS